MTGLILAGGENRRMPVLKGFLDIGGRPIIENTVSILGDVLGKVAISTNMPERYFRYGVPLIGDIMCHRGPLSGIFSGLTATGAESVFVVACDMPFIRKGLVRYMADAYESLQKQADAMIPRFRGFQEPLFGIYARTALPMMERVISQALTGMQGLLKGVNTVFIDEEAIREFDPTGESFINVNTVEDYERIGGNICSA